MFIRPVLYSQYLQKKQYRNEKNNTSFYKSCEFCSFETAQAIKHKSISFSRGPFYAVDKNCNYKRYERNHKR